MGLLWNMLTDRPLIALVDLGDGAARVLRAASYWAFRMQRPLVVVHHVVVHAPALSSSEVRTALRTSVLDRVHEEVLALCRRSLGRDRPVAEVVVDDQPLVPLVLNMATARKATMVVAGMKQKGLLSRMLLGNTVLDLVDELTVPLLAVPCEEVALEHEPVLFLAVGPTVEPDTERLSQLLMQYAGLDAELRLFTLLEEGMDPVQARQRLETVAARMPTARPAGLEVIQGMNGPAELREWLKGCAGAVLVVQRGERGIKDLLMRRFFVNDLVDDGRLPLLMLP